MADFLDQLEIDKLIDVAKESKSKLSKLYGNSSEIKNKNFTAYDFKRPNRVSKDQLRVLSSIHEKISRIVSNKMSTMIKNIVEVNFISADQMTYNEFIMSINSPTLFNIYKVKPINGKCVIEFNRNIIRNFLDRMLGGNGLNEQLTKQEFTDIELNILGIVSNTWEEELNHVWSSVQHLEFALESSSSNHNTVQIAARNEIIILTTYEVKIREEVGYISICYPVIYLEPILDKLMMNVLVEAKNRTSESLKAEMREVLLNSEVNVEGVILEKSVNFTDFLDLQIGDVIQSDVFVEDPAISIYIANKLKWFGYMGEFKKNKAIHLSRKYISPTQALVDKLRSVNKLKAKDLSLLINKWED